MCGIAVIIAGIRINLSSLLLDFTHDSSSLNSQSVAFLIDDLEEALGRRGPDSLGSKKLLLHLNKSSSSDEDKVLSLIEVEEQTVLQCYRRKHEAVISENGELEGRDFIQSLQKSFGELHFIGATLQLRGLSPITQPLVDSSGNILVYNGEIFGGIHVDSDSNDAEILMQSLGSCCSCSALDHLKVSNLRGNTHTSVPELLSTIKGPWALIYWQESTKTLWFGRDAFGRRSLLVHWPTLEDPHLILSSVAPKSPLVISSDSEVESENNNHNFWEELLCGVYSLSVNGDKCLSSEIRRHEWTNSRLKELVEWERESVVPKHEDLCISKSNIQSNYSDKLPFQPGLIPAHRVRNALKESVMRRTTMNRIFQGSTCDLKRAVPVAVLFSGGLDSMILAALLDECLEASYEIDLLNVSFDGRSAPDRISARAGVKELERISPLRRWRLVEIDAELSKLTLETKHVMSLINPAKTYMDLNIGIALWLAASGDGWVYERINNNVADDPQLVKYKSEARILLVGAGADEQCGGYGRHRTRYKAGSWLGLHEEMKLDMQRIWKRNLGRDDRCLADNGKEARFPFLDEDVIKTLLDIPLWDVADLNQPSGSGDKKILREVAQLLCLYEAATLPKRAIQFGSRISRESNRKNYGSNRAANQASAGSAIIHKP